MHRLAAIERPARRWRWMILLGALLLAGCSGIGHGSFLHPHGPIAADDRHTLLITVLLMLIVVVPVFILTPLFAWRYRRGNTRAVYRPRWEFSLPLEILVWGVPVLIVIALGVIVWQQSHRLDPYRPIASASAPLDVQVIGMDWKWLFIYPQEHIATVNELVIPANRPVHMSLTSDTVMQSLLVPELAGQIYAMAGMRTQLNMLASHTGTYLGENTQYNGDGFQKQKFQVHAVSAAQFAHWVEQVRSNGQTLDAARYALLAKPSVLPAPEQFGNVTPGLFYQVIGHFCPMCAEQLQKTRADAPATQDAKASHD